MYSPSKRMLVMSGNVDIRVSGGRLKLRYGFPLDGTVTEESISRGTCDVDHIVILGKSGTVTLDSIQWLMDMRIVVSLVDYQGNLVTDMLPTEHISPIVKKRQACTSSKLQRKLALGLLQEKLRGQLKTLQGLKTIGLDGGPLTVGAKQSIRQGIDQLRKLQGALLKCQSPDKMIYVEAQAGIFYWEAFDGISLKWKVTTAKPIPEHWLTIGARQSPKSKNARYAISPFHACLNYLYACLESKIKRYCIAYRLDVDFPVLHSDYSPNRSALIYDLMEPVRPLVDLLLYQFMGRTTLRPSDFFETRQGVCKVLPELASKIIPLVRSLDPDINRIVKEFATNFKTRMVQAHPDDDLNSRVDGNDSLDTVEGVVQN
jgi:CRISPR-associated protein Cas1